MEAASAALAAIQAESALLRDSNDRLMEELNARRVSILPSPITRFVPLSVTAFSGCRMEIITPNSFIL
ncbi:hypothetical protein ACS0TY_013762 [Phlomoides rotata]